MNFEKFKKLMGKSKDNVGFGIPKPEKVLEDTESLKKNDLKKEETSEKENIKITEGEGFTMRDKTRREMEGEKKNEKKAGEKEGLKEKLDDSKEKEEALVRENYVKAQLNLEKVRRVGGYDHEDFKAKMDAANKKLEEGKEAYFKILKEKESMLSGYDLERSKDAKLFEKNRLGLIAEEFGKLQDAKINLRAEEEAERSFFPVNAIKEIGNWYRKQPAKQKYIVSAGLIGGGILAGIAGSAVLASAVGTTAIVSRILSGAGTAVALENVIAQGKGKKFGIHMGHKGLMEEKTAQEIEKIAKGVSVGSATDFFDKNEAALASVSEKLYKESKKLETERALISGAMGAVIATGAFSEAIKNAVHWTGADKAVKNVFDWTKGHLQGVSGHEATKVVGVAGVHNVSAEAAGNHEIRPGAEVHKLVSVESEDVRKLATIRKGEGVTQVLERQLEHDPAKFGFTGHDVNNANEVHKWAQKHAYELAVKNGFISEKSDNILSGTQRVLEKDPLHYGFKGDIKDISKVHEWALKQAHEAASKTGTDVPVALETRVKWDYSQSADKQAAFVLSPDGKVTEIVSSAKNPDFLYKSAGMEKLQKEIDPISKQIEESNKAIDKLNIDVEREYRHNIVPGANVSHHYEKLLNKELDHEKILEAQKKAFEDNLKVHGGNDHVAHNYYSDIKKSPIIEKRPANFVEMVKDKVSVKNSGSVTAMEHVAAHKEAVQTAAEAAGVHEKVVELNKNLKLLFKYDDKNNITNIVPSGYLSAEDKWNARLLLKRDWMGVAKERVAENNIRMMPNSIQMNVEAASGRVSVLNSYAKSLNTNSPEFKAVKKVIENVIKETEKNYGKVFK